MTERVLKRVAAAAIVSYENEIKALNQKINLLETQKADWEKFQKDPLTHTLTPGRKNGAFAYYVGQVVDVMENKDIFPSKEPVVYPESFFEERLGQVVPLKISCISRNGGWQIVETEGKYTVESVHTDKEGVLVSLQLEEQTEEESYERILVRNRLTRSVFKNCKHLDVYYSKGEVICVYRKYFDKDGNGCGTGDMGSIYLECGYIWFEVNE